MGMTDTSEPDGPLYTQVKADLDIDPEVIGSRPKWSFKETMAQLDRERKKRSAPASSRRRKRAG